METSKELRDIRKELRELRNAVAKLGLTPEERMHEEITSMLTDDWVNFVETQHKLRGWIPLDQLDKEYKELLKNRRNKIEK